MAFNPETAYEDAADLMLDALQEFMGVAPTRTRTKTKTALINILKYFFVARSEPGPVNLTASVEDCGTN